MLRRVSVVPTETPAGGDAHATGTCRRARAIVAALAVTQTIGYGALYYSFAILLTPLAHDLHASTTAVTGAFTAAVLAGAVVAVPVGRRLDRHGGRGLMTTGSLAGTALLASLSMVDSLVALYAVWIGIGLASAMAFYEAAFAVIVTWYPSPQRRANALLAVTVVAGFASSVFLPLTGALVDRYGWRTAVVILAAAHGLITVPLHAVLVRRPIRSANAGPTGTDSHTARRNAVRTALHDRYFWIFTVAFVANAAALSTLTVHLVAYLVELGHAAVFAATVAGLLGVLSVTGRLAVTGAATSHPAHHRGRRHLPVAGRRRRDPAPRRPQHDRRDQRCHRLRTRVRGRHHRPPRPAGRPLRHGRLRHHHRADHRAPDHRQSRRTRRRRRPARRHGQLHPGPHRRRGGLRRGRGRDGHDARTGNGAPGLSRARKRTGGRHTARRPPWRRCCREPVRRRPPPRRPSPRGRS